MIEELNVESINNEYDYSTAIIKTEYVVHLVQYLNELNKQLTRFVEEDAEKNQQFKAEYRNYMYKKSFSQKLEICVKDKEYKSTYYDEYEEFMSAVNNGLVNNIGGLNIKLWLNFWRGTGDNLNEHKNEFEIRINPYEIKFKRTSNYNDPAMNNIEQQLKEIMSKIPAENSIFCSK